MIFEQKKSGLAFLKQDRFQHTNET